MLLSGGSHHVFLNGFGASSSIVFLDHAQMCSFPPPPNCFNFVTPRPLVSCYSYASQYLSQYIWYFELVSENFNAELCQQYFCSYAGINLTGYHCRRANPRITNFFRQNPRPRDSFSVQNSPQVKKGRQNPHPRA